MNPPLTPLQNVWENNLEIVGNRGVKKREDVKQKEARQQVLDVRRSQLRALLEAEHEQYIIEIGANVETELDRQARMRDRAKVLREQRETEREETAAAKKYQQWMVNSEELRTMRSKLECEVSIHISHVSI